MQTDKHKEKLDGNYIAKTYFTLQRADDIKTTWKNCFMKQQHLKENNMQVYV
jgi:hypothetical protein